MVYHVQRRPFFAYKENAFALGQEIGHKIGNGLAFTRARRTLYDIAVAAAAVKDGIGLRGIGCNNMVPFGRAVFAVFLKRFAGRAAEQLVEDGIINLLFGHIIV